LPKVTRTTTRAWWTIRSSSARSALTISNTRSRAQKLDFYRAVNRELTERLGCSPDDIFINVVGVLPENWSFGQGRAQNIE